MVQIVQPISARQNTTLVGNIRTLSQAFAGTGPKPIPEGRDVFSASTDLKGDFPRVFKEQPPAQRSLYSSGDVQRFRQALREKLSSERLDLTPSSEERSNLVNETVAKLKGMNSRQQRSFLEQISHPHTASPEMTRNSQIIAADSIGRLIRDQNTHTGRFNGLLVQLSAAQPAVQRAVGPSLTYITDAALRRKAISNLLGTGKIVKSPGIRIINGVSETITERRFEGSSPEAGLMAAIPLLHHLTGADRERAFDLLGAYGEPLIWDAVQEAKLNPKQSVPYKAGSLINPSRKKD